MDPQVITLRDGRALGFEEAGDPAGVPVIALHGTPGSRHHLLADVDTVRSAGVRFIVPDRPGYGLSSYHHGRTLRDFADDVRDLADHLGLDRFAIAGMSGGGPHAIAVARYLPDRVTTLSILSGLAPVAAAGTEAGMMPANRIFVRLARRLPGANRLPFGLMTWAGRRWPDRLVAAISKSFAEADAAVFRDAGVATAFRRDLAEASATTGRAAAQDFSVLAHDWGFRLEEVTTRTFVWQAEDDLNVPAAHARTQASAIPGAVLHLLPTGGHLVTVVHLREILDEVVAANG